MRNKYKVVWVIGLLLLFTLACSLLGGDEGTSGEAETSFEGVTPTTGPAPTEVAVAEEAETEVTEEVQAVVTEEVAAPATEEASESEQSPFNARASLAELSAYRVNFSMDFDGQSGDQPSKGTVKLFLEVTKDPAARHLQMSMEGSTVEELGGSGNLEVYRLGETVYLKNAPEAEWISFSGSEADVFESGFFAPDEDLELPETALCDSTPETINGVPAIHCQFSETDVPTDQATYESLTGDVWVAEDGNYVIKYHIEATGFQSLEEGEGLFDFGNIILDYEVSDINGDFAISSPEDVQATDSPGPSGETGGQTPETEFPLLEDASEVTALSGFLTYYTASEIEAVVEFYRQELTAANWQEQVDQGYSDEATGILYFDKEGTTLLVTIIKEAEGRVNVILTTQ